MSEMTPQEVAQELDKHIIGQDAKRAVAIALRNRWRRMRRTGAGATKSLPKNILMIGPTGWARPKSPGGWETGQHAVHQRSGHQVHRGRLRGPRRESIIRDLMDERSR